MSFFLNGKPLVVHRVARYYEPPTEGLDYEDFAETIRRAKQRGQIVDGPPMVMDRIPQKADKRKPITAICVICSAPYPTFENYQRKTCREACTKLLRLEVHRQRHARERATAWQCVSCGHAMGKCAKNTPCPKCKCVSKVQAHP